MPPTTTAAPGIATHPVPSPVGRTVVATACGLLFALLTAAVVAHATGIFDRDLIVLVRDWASPIVTTIMRTATLSSGSLAAPAAFAIAFVVWRRLGGRAALNYAACCVSGEALDLLIKAVVHRTRPHGLSPLLTHAGWYAFPSADAMFAAIAYGLGAVLLARTVSRPAARAAILAGGAGIVLLDCVARVYLGAHWPTDVMGGALAGTTTAALWLGAPGLVAAMGARTARAERGGVARPGVR